MKTREGNHIDCQLPQVSIELTRETETSGHSGHGQGHQVVQISISRVGKFKGAEANVIQCFVVNAIRLVSIFHKLVN